MPEPIRMEVLAASRGRFLKTPKVSETAHKAYHQAMKGESASLLRVVTQAATPGLFQGLSLTIRFKSDLIDLAAIPGLLPGHLQRLDMIDYRTPSVFEVTLSGPVLSLARAVDCEGTPWGLLTSFTKTIAEEFPEDSLLALQALIDRRKDANHVATQQDPQGIHAGSQQAGETPSQA